MPVTLTDEQAAAITLLLRGIASHLDTCDPQAFACYEGQLEEAIAALTREPAPCPSCDGVQGRGVEGHHERCVTRLGGRAVWGLRDLPAVDGDPAPAADDDEWGPPIVPGGERVNPLEPDLPDRVIAAAGGTANACHLLGWQGGTVHQVREEIDRRIKERGERCASSEPAPCPHRELLREFNDDAFLPCLKDDHQSGGDCGCTNCGLLRRLNAALASAQPCAVPPGCQLRKALEAVSADARRWPCTCGPISPYGEADNRCDNCALQQSVAAALVRPCAAPGEPSQEDFDGMQRWLDDALRTCRDDDHKRLKYLQADVRILAAARRWVARAAPGEAGEWEEIYDGIVQHCFDSERVKVYRRRAPEREGGAR